MHRRSHATALADVGFGAGLTELGAAQRASLGRGLALLLTLTLAGLALVYGPLALGSDGPVRPSPAAKPLAAAMPRLPLVAAAPGPLPH